MISPDTTDVQNHAAEIIKRGGVIAFCTDTFYGLGADPFSTSAVERIRDLKGREGDKPILVLVSDRGQVDRMIAKRSTVFDRLAIEFWPGPLTIIGTAASDLPSALPAGSKTVGVRLPDDDKVRALVMACGCALTATSANPAGEPPAESAADVERYFGDRIDVIVDGGRAKTDRPSTVVDATNDEVKLVREGMISWAQIQAALGKR